ncbi:MAG: hypothetical protein MJZ74_04260 [Muribaculaceae bacterium]|nr:hypothetical protein [Muribaculaceae bacterium]
MKKFLLSMVALVAMCINANAQVMTVPAELNGWYAGYYAATNIDVETLKGGVMQWLSIDGLDGNSWDESQQEWLERTNNWGDLEDPYSFYGQVKDSKFFVAGDMASKNYYAFLLVNGPRLSAGTEWRMYIPKQRGAYTFTKEDLFLQGVFGQGLIDPKTGIESIEVAPANAKAVKMIENGQLIIKKNGVKYNVNGQVVE